MDWQTWIRQSLPRTDYMRGGATIWQKGASRLLDDKLGPILHIHDEASEIFYFVAGQCRLEVGDSEEFFEAGDFVLVPPQVPHNVWRHGDDDLLVLWIVAPHFQANKWRTDNFPDDAMQKRAIRGRVTAGGELPSDDQIENRLLTLPGGASQPGCTAETQESVIYVVEGEAAVRVGKLSGRLSAHEFVHVPVDTEYSIDCHYGPALVILFRFPRSARA